MRIAYADPPYPGCSRIYKDHADYAGEVDHEVLVEKLERDFPDGWALSTSASALKYVLALLPDFETSEFRVCAWIRATVPRPPARVMWAWEPVLVRIPHWRQRHDHDFVRDTLTGAGQPSGFLGGSITGQKPTAFCYWLFDVLGLGADDEFVDLYPGSGAVTQAWERWRSQLRLEVG